MLNFDDCRVLGGTEDGWSLVAGLGELDGVLGNIFGGDATLVGWICVIFPMDRCAAIPRQIRFAARKMIFVGGGFVGASGETKPAESS